MARERKAVEIGNMPERLRLAEEVHDSEEPRVLHQDGRELAVLMPVKPSAKRRARRKKTAAELEAFRSAAGGWADLDTDKLIADIYEGRDISTRPPGERWGRWRVSCGGMAPESARIVPASAT